eukprot:152420_1
MSNNDIAIAETSEKQDHDEETKVHSITVEDVAEYEEYDSDEEETAFGTTISDFGYMNQFKKHNRVHTKTKYSSGLVSPDKTPAHVRFTGSPEEPKDKTRTLTSDGTTVHAMEAAAKYYNELQRTGSPDSPDASLYDDTGRFES